MLVHRASGHGLIPCLSVARALHMSLLDFSRNRFGNRPVRPSRQAEMQEYLAEMQASGQDMEDNYDPSMEEVLEQVPKTQSDILREKNFSTLKTIENKYYSDLYKIQPGEVYQKYNDPYFKRVKDNPDFHHKHHSTAKRMAQAEQEHKALMAKFQETEKPAKYSPLNVAYFAEELYSNSGNKTKREMSKSQESTSLTDGLYTAKYEGKMLKGNDERGRYRTASSVTGTAPNQSHAETDQEAVNGQSSFIDYNGPSLLLWSMKEQMRYLHSTDPEYWTPQLLASIFPIHPDKVKLVLRDKWRPEDDASEQRHDLRVLENWKTLTKGKLASEALVRKIVAERAATAGAPASGLPVPVTSTPQMNAVLENLIFEEPPLAIDQGVSRQEIPVRKQPKAGFFVDILRKYQAQVENLQSNNSRDEISDGESDCAQEDSGSEITNIAAVLPVAPAVEGQCVRVAGTSVRQPLSSLPGSARRQSVRRGAAVQDDGYVQTALPRTHLTYREYLQIKKNSTDTKKVNERGMPKQKFLKHETHRDQRRGKYF